MSRFRDCMRYSFVASNGILWALSLALLLYITAKATGSLSEMNLIFGFYGMEYILMAMGTLVFITGFIGCFVGTRLNRNILITFLVLACLYFVFGCVVMAGLGLRLRDVSDFWANTEEEIRYEYQETNECCGYSDASSEYGSQVPISCYNMTTVDDVTYFTPWEDTCSTKVEQDSVTSVLTSLIAIVSLILIDDIAGIATGSYVLRKLRRRKETENSGQDDKVVKKKKQKYRFVRGPINLGREYSDMDDIQTPQ